MTIGILCAIPEETKAFGSGLNILSTQRVGDNAFHSGKLYGVDMTLVECGIGKVNAAFATTILCDHFKCSSLIFSGIAGGIDPELQVGDVVIADRLLQVDYGRFQDGAVIPFRAGNVPFGAAVGEIGYVMPYDLKEKILPLLNKQLPQWEGRRPNIKFGTVLTGDVFLNDSRQREKYFAAHGAAAIEMEGGAVAQIAEKYNVNAVIIRALSDLAGDDSHLDFVSFGHFAAVSAAALVQETLALIKPKA